ncbi:MAG: hypothetical protein MPW14_23820 [Candidatus Manganitrophus sp.]|nr:MAG: hypothetical protein MPW14_23820 [Candidatus Manganitrophus sp.]
MTAILKGNEKTKVGCFFTIKGRTTKTSNGERIIASFRPHARLNATPPAITNEGTA